MLIDFVLNLGNGQKSGLRLNSNGQVLHVAPGMAADVAGLKVDDKIVAVDKVSVGDRTAVQLWADGKDLPIRAIRVERGGSLSGDNTHYKQLSFELSLNPGEKSGLRINNKGEILAVHPGTAAHNAGLQAGDIVIAVDGMTATAQRSAVQLWTEGASRTARSLQVLREVVEAETSKARTTDDGLTTLPVKEYEFRMRMVAGEKSGLRINSKGAIVVVHPGSVAHAAGMLVGDVVTAVDGIAVEEGSSSRGAVQLWSDGRERAERTLTVRRTLQPSAEPHQPVSASSALESRKPPPTAAMHVDGCIISEFSAPRAESAPVRRVDFELKLGDQAKSGLRLNTNGQIVGVTPGMAADIAGLKPGDTIVAVDKMPVTDERTALQLWVDGKDLIIRQIQVERICSTPEPATQQVASSVTTPTSIPVEPASSKGSAKLDHTDSNSSQREAELEFQMKMIAGEKSGLRINSKGGIVAVHPGSVAHAAGLAVGDVVIAVDGATVKPGSDTQSAVQLWSEGRDRPIRLLRVRRQPVSPAADGPCSIAGAPQDTSPRHQDVPKKDLSQNKKGQEIDFVLHLGNNSRVGLRINTQNAISHVHSDTVAQRAGVQAGDIVLAVDGTLVGPGEAGALKLWTEGLGQPTRTLKVRRTMVLEGSNMSTTMDEKVDHFREVAPAADDEPEMARKLRVAMIAAEDHKNDGNRSLASGMTNLAIGLYSSAIDVLQPHVLPLLTEQGHVNAEVVKSMADPRGSIPKAIEALASYYSNRSSAYLSSDDPMHAICDAKEVVRLRPKWLKGYVRLGAAFSQACKPVEAARSYEQALALDPENPQLQERMRTAASEAVVFEAQQRYEEKARQIREAQSKVVKLEEIAQRIRSEAEAAAEVAIMNATNSDVVARPADTAQSNVANSSYACAAAAPAAAALQQRDSASQSALIAALQEEFVADDLYPPHISTTWSEQELREWFDCGGSGNMCQGSMEASTSSGKAAPHSEESLASPTAGETNDDVSESQQATRSALDSVREAAREMARQAAKEAADEAVREVEMKTAQERYASLCVIDFCVSSLIMRTRCCTCCSGATRAS
ncbi:hypothetical protein AB1Y20_006038 [Prymnesium parvum]|uniref:PDZ domain-containing protein n=1 Tax=Prymnesium parvum TaxID=97485 RepID=A0AB34J1F7_PRYPA